MTSNFQIQISVFFHYHIISDCGGKVCLNGGTLNLDTCQCDCLKKPWIRQNGNCACEYKSVYILADTPLVPSSTGCVIHQWLS